MSSLENIPQERFHLFVFICFQNLIISFKIFFDELDGIFILNIRGNLLEKGSFEF